MQVQKPQHQRENEKEGETKQKMINIIPTLLTNAQADKTSCNIIPTLQHDINTMPFHFLLLCLKTPPVCAIKFS